MPAKKIDYSERMKVIEKRQENPSQLEEPTEKETAQKSKQIPYANRICPFMSTPEKDVYCTARCKLFRDQKAGYNCPFPEIFAISWKLGIGKKKK